MVIVKTKHNMIMGLFVLAVAFCFFMDWAFVPYLTNTEQFISLSSGSSLAHGVSAYNFAGFCNDWAAMNGGGTSAGAASGLRIIGVLSTFFWLMGFASLVVCALRLVLSKKDIGAFSCFVWTIASAGAFAGLVAFANMLIGINSHLYAEASPTIWIGIIIAVSIAALFILSSDKSV